ncbi:cytochrome P450 [Nevskia sp.]|uniref:cytochrome P450 n=1 Tax=Nevskia sp. TaxID=1929292 RepID=UPI003F6FF9C1
MTDVERPAHAVPAADSATPAGGGGSRLREAPHHRSWPVIGSSLAYIRDADTFLRRLHERHGDVAKIDAFGTQCHFLFGPDANQFVLQNRGNLFENARWSYFIGPFFRRGLMLMDFDEHRLHRRIMNAAFSHEALSGYFDRMQRSVDAELAGWDAGDCLLFKRLKAMTLNIGSEVFVGSKPGDDADAINDAFLDTVQAATGLIRYPVPGTRWNAGLKGRKLLERHFARALPGKRAHPGADLFSRLCEARTDDGELFSDDDVVNHMIFVLMAAHDTSTITLSNLLYQLARQPAWQERLREECRAIGSGALAFADLDRFEDTTLAIKETLRIAAPVPMLPRGVTEECAFNGVRLPKGAMVAVTPWLTHHLPEWWTDPARFDPDRFGSARAEDRRHPFLWTPFGGGAHKCIGLHFGMMEVKTILHRLLLTFRFTVPESYVMPQDFTSLPIPKDRLPMRLERLA